MVASAAAQEPAISSLQPAAVRFQAEFAYITSIRELRDGSVIVADVLDQRLVLIDDPASPSARQISRTGDGPGEYRVPRWLYALGGDSTLVTDAQERRWLVLSGRRVVRTVSAHEGLPRILGPNLKGADEHGRILQLRYDTRRRSLGEADSAVVVLADRATGRMDTIARIFRPSSPVSPVRPSGSAVGYMLRNPLVVNEQAVLFRDGWVALALADPYRVDWITPDGTRLPGAPLPFERLPVDDLERRVAAERRSYPSQGVHFEPRHFLAWPPVLPAFVEDGLLAAPDGRLLIRRMRSARDSSTTYDIVDRNGALVRKLRLPANQYIIGFGSRSAYVVSKDEFDVQTLQRHPWP